MCIAALLLASATLLDDGYTAMYNLDFATARRDFGQWQSAHPEDPMGPASDAARILFSEFARLHVLESEFFTEDESFTARQANLQPDPASKQQFESDIAESRKLAAAILQRDPDSENALLATVLCGGLHADYLALIEKRNLAALSEMKQSRELAERLLTLHPDCYDANLAVGVENYLLSLKPMPVRWILHLGGAETDKDAGVKQLRITAEKGHYLLPYARLLLAVSDLRAGDRKSAFMRLSWLASNFPGNALYRIELSKFK